MKIISTAMAGTLESSDVQVTIEPEAGQLQLDIQSSVLNQYGRQIQKVVLETLGQLGVSNDAKVTLVDKGALDCTIQARVACAVFRAANYTGQIPWGGAVEE